MDFKFVLLASDFLLTDVCDFAGAESPLLTGEGDCFFNLPDLLGDGEEGEMSGTFISLSEGESLVKVLCLTGPAGLDGEEFSSLSVKFSGDDDEFDDVESGRVKVLDLG